MPRDERLPASAKQLQREAPLGSDKRVDGLALVGTQREGGFRCRRHDLYAVRLGVERQAVVHQHASRVRNVLAQVDLQRHGGVYVPRRPQTRKHDVQERSQVVGADEASTAVLGLPRVVRHVALVVDLSRQKVHAVVAKAWSLASFRVRLGGQPQQAVLVEVVDEAALEQLLLRDDLLAPHRLACDCHVVRGHLDLIASDHLAGHLRRRALLVLALANGFQLRERRRLGHAQGLGQNACFGLVLCEVSGFKCVYIFRAKRQPHYFSVIPPRMAAAPTELDTAMAALALTNPAAAAIVRNALEAKDAVITTMAAALETKDETITTLVSKVTRERYAFLRSRSCAADFRRYQKYY